MFLKLETAQQMLAAAKAKCVELQKTPSIAIVDPGGHLLAFARMNGGRTNNVEIAQAKARGAAAFRRDASEMTSIFEQNANFVTQLMHLMGDRLMIDIGSCVIRSKDGELLGAIAISGASAEEDEVIARAAILAVKDKL